MPDRLLGEGVTKPDRIGSLATEGLVVKEAIQSVVGLVLTVGGIYVLTLVNENVYLIFPFFLLALVGIALLGTGVPGLLSGTDEAVPGDHH